MSTIPYHRQADFSDYEVENPNTPKRGTDLDAEFDAIKNTTDNTQANLALIQRDDGKLRNLSVHPDALANAVRALVLLQGADIRGAWATDTLYKIGDVVQGPSSAAFICYATHTSGVFADDQPTHWLQISEPTNLTPRMWTFVGDGETTQFYLPGADIADERLYQAVVGGVTQQPPNPDGDPPTDGDFTVTITPDTDGSYINFTTAPGNLVDGWVVLLGYPQTAPVDFITSLINNEDFQEFLRNLITNTVVETTQILQLGPTRILIPLFTIADSSATLDKTYESGLIRCTSGDATTLTIRNNTGDADHDWAPNPIAAPYFSVVQRGDGAVTVDIEDGGTITCPAGYLPSPRAKGSVITLTGDYVSGGQWLCSGDMAADA